MTLSPGAYLKHRRAAAGLSVDDVAAATTTEPRWAAHTRTEWIERIEADIMPASFATVAVLRAIYRFDLSVLARLALIHLGNDVPAPEVCRICACSWNDPCRDAADPGHAGACHWHDDGHTICSRCAALATGEQADAA